MQTDYDYYLTCKAKVESLKKDWKLKKLSNEDALQYAKDWKQALMFYVGNEGPTPTRAKIEELIAKLNKLIDDIKEDMKTIYVLRTTNLYNNNIHVASSDENLLKKCAERLKVGTQYEISPLKVCNTEKELNEQMNKGYSVPYINK